MFEFLVQTILEGLFVNHGEQNLEVGGDDVQDTMKTKSESYNREASETLLVQICDILFDNTHRYLRMKSLFPKDFVLNERKCRFDYIKPEDDSSFNEKNRCPRDVANYINKNGGHRIFSANRKLEAHMNLLKVQMLIQKIQEQGSIESESALAEIIRKIATDSLSGSERSIANAPQFIINRDYRILAAIKQSSW